MLPVSLLRLLEICVGFVPTLSKRQENAQFSVNGAAHYAARVKFIMVTQLQIKCVKLCIVRLMRSTPAELTAVCSAAGPNMACQNCSKASHLFF